MTTAAEPGSNSVDPSPADPSQVDAAVVDAVRLMFTGPDGGPVRTHVRQVDADRLAHPPTRATVVVPDPADVARLVPDVQVTGALLVGTGAAAVLVFTTEPVADHHERLAAAVTSATAGLVESVDRLRAEVAVVDALHSVGRQLTAQLDIDRIVQDATDAATKATGAAFGAFFYNLINDLGESYTLYTLSGVPREAFSRFPMPRNTAVFGPTFDGQGTVRSPDITADPRFGHNPPYHGMPKGHLPVCSYLAVSVLSPTSGEVLGGFFFGHPSPNQFTERHEYLAEGIAGYTAIALDNGRLFERERNLATELSTSMLPVVPDIPGLDIVARYLPAATGIKVGGDWFDVIRLASGATAFIIGDVVGHGVTAATVMGQVRTAIRSYALLELPPAAVLRNVSYLTTSLFDPGFVTCFYAVHSPGDNRLTYANAGHPPAVLMLPDGTIDLIGEALAKPLGVGVEFPERTTVFPPGADLVLYTDGLVEAQVRDLTVGTERLIDGLRPLRTAADIGAGCDELVELLTQGKHDDDIALIYVHNDTSGNGVDPDGEFHRHVAATPDQASEIRNDLADWLAGHPVSDQQQGDIVLAAYEAMANAAEHAYRDVPAGTIEVRATWHDGEVTVSVSDHGTWKLPDLSDDLRGRGLILMGLLAHDVSTTQRADGTTVTLTWRLDRHAVA